MEMLVVLALVGLLMGIVIPMVGDVMNLRIKGSARRLAATVQFLYAKAATQRLYVRLVYDLDKQSYWAESSRDRFLLVHEDEKTRAEMKEKQEAKLAGEGETEDEAEAEKEPEGGFSGEEGYLLKPTDLPPDVQFKDIYAQHQEEPITQGQAYTYFFPNGQVEWSIINLKDEGDTVHYSLEVMPITGRVTIRKDYLDYKEAQNPTEEE